MWPHPAKDVPTEPDTGWMRKNYTGPKANPAGGVRGPRDFGEMETDRDLDKTIQQLLCDVHEGLGEWRRFTAAHAASRVRTPLPEEAFQATDLILYSLARTASMQAVAARESQKTQRCIKGLTVCIVALTIALLALTGVLVWRACW